MDKQFFINAGIPPQFDQPILPTWHSDLHFPAIQSSDCFFDSAITSMVSSPVSTSNSNESFAIRELIGKLGNICNPGEISPPELNPPVSVAGASSTYVSANNSCYSTPMSSPQKMNIGTINRAIMENFNTHLGNSINVPSIGSNLPSITGDPGFVERAALFSSFGSRSFNGRNTQFPCPNGSELSTRFTGSGKLQRVSSSPTINVSQMAENRNPITNESVSRKRKSQQKGKCREIPCSSPPKVLENGDDSNSKRSKLNDESKNSKTEQKLQEEEDESKNQKPPEAPKDYIHVRARRGQATDSHSLAERVRREKISERMKLLQDLVPGCNKVTGKALMLEEIINYVQSLQRQVEFLSMKLSTVNPTSMDLNTNNHFHKNAFEPNSCMQTQQAYPLDNLTPTLYGGHQDPQNHLQQNGITSNGMDPHFPNPMDPMNQSHNMQLPTTNGFNNGVPQLCEGDLHTIVQMGFTYNSTTFEPQSLQGGSNEAPTMKAEF